MSATSPITALSRRLPAILALGSALLLSVGASALLVRMVEKRSLSDVTGILHVSGYDWAKVQVDGLQVRLTGTAPTEAERFRALTAAGSMVESTRVIDEMTVADTDLRAPDFSIEILRNGGQVSLIGLVPKATDQQALTARLQGLGGVEQVADLLDSADHPLPDGWQDALDYAVQALDRLPSAKITIGAGTVRVTAIANSIADQRQLVASLGQAAPEGVRVAMDISAPRPTITPFTLRFVIEPGGAARFDACSADTPEGRDAIVAAAISAGLTGRATCTVGIGAPSPRWQEAAVAGIQAVGALKGGSVTISDADVALVAPDTTPKDAFDSATGTLQRTLPEGFSLHAVLTQPVKVDGSGEGDGPPELVATLAEGKLKLRGRIRDEREQDVIEGYAKAMFGAAAVDDTTRTDDRLPEGWAIRVLAALQSLRQLESGQAVVQADYLSVKGETGATGASDDISRLLGEKLGTTAHMDIAVTYNEKLDPTLGLPTPQECVAQINAAIAARKISFAPGSADIEPGAGPTLDKIAASMKTCADVPMEVGGYTDSQGRDSMNLDLSQSRAEAVVAALQSRRSLVGNLTAKGYGEEDPIADNGTEDGREANRRIEFKLLEDAQAAADAKSAARPAPPARPEPEDIPLDPTGPNDSD